VVSLIAFSNPVLAAGGDISTVISPTESGVVSTSDQHEGILGVVA
jgi:hypothetical protein